ncbi:MAG: hypothetical protein B6D77_11745 [gamma proteobacterium symbiont of Ctena orbiculata]|nr:MAG: hypothetical protein B6D77_11745 [gamma proteobacterium symbiont of Ctena orbiculata]
MWIPTYRIYGFYVSVLFKCWGYSETTGACITVAPVPTETLDNKQSMTSPDSKLPDEYDQDVEKSTNSDRLRVVLEIAIAALILTGIYFLFAPEEEIDLAPPLEQSQIDPIIRAQIDSAAEQPSPVEEETSTTETSTTEDDTSNLDIAAADNPPVQAADTEGGPARGLISRLRSGEATLDPHQILNQVDAYRKEGMLTDAYLLLFYAAREGDGGAAFSLADMHDPNHFNKANPLLDKPDSYQAHKWYSVAAGKGLDKANERLKSLKRTTEAQAKKGDLAAQRLLLNWQ